MANNATPLTTVELVRQVHYILQGKGGVGKLLIVSVTAQYIRSKGRPLVVHDTDPVNAILAGYEASGTQRLELMRESSLVEHNFDRLTEQIVEDDSDFVMDNGTASLIPLSYYLVENDAINLTAESGKQAHIHTAITGGQALRDMLGGFAFLCGQMPGDARLVVWLNEFFGDVEAEGKTFKEMKVYQSNKDRMYGIVRIVRQTGSIYGEDMRLTLDSKLTSDEIKQSPDLGFMPKSRLNKVKSSPFEQLDTIV